VTSQPLLVFHNQLDNDSNIWGRLELFDTEEYPIVRPRERYIATSGLPGYQEWAGQEAKGRGPIPRMDEAEIPCYFVDTKPIHMPSTPGVEGNFYVISPHTIASGRGDFGIHFDANVPGSAGCVVIRNSEAWTAFEQRMNSYFREGVGRIPLLICYS
jgi:hypothetical protein